MQSIDTTSGNPVRADKIGCGYGMVRLYGRRGRWACDEPVRQIRALPTRNAPHERPEDLLAQAPGVAADAWALLPGAEILDAAERLTRKAAEMTPAFDRRWRPLTTVV